MQPQPESAQIRNTTINTTTNSVISAVPKVATDIRRETNVTYPTKTISTTTKLQSSKFNLTSLLLPLNWSSLQSKVNPTHNNSLSNRTLSSGRNLTTKTISTLLKPISLLPGPTSSSGTLLAPIISSVKLPAPISSSTTPPASISSSPTPVTSSVTLPVPMSSSTTLHETETFPSTSTPVTSSPEKSYLDQSDLNLLQLATLFPGSKVYIDFSNKNDFINVLS